MKYKVILADPPWEFNKRKVPKNNEGLNSKFGFGAHQYSTGLMKIEDICSLGEKINKIVTEDAYLFLWVCESKPYYHLPVLDAWGFDVVTTAFTWVKTYPSEKLFCGPGKYTFSNIERCLLARKNKKKFPCWHSTAQGVYKPEQIVLEPHPRDEKTKKIIHSRKPEAVHQRIEQWLKPYILQGEGMLELFATQEREGWTTLGHHLTGTDIRDDLDSLSLV